MNPTKAPRPEQIEDLVSIIKNDRFMLLSDPGTGKTIPACLAMYWRWSEKHERSVWVMPTTLLVKNRDELLEWSEFKEDDVLIYEGQNVTTDPKVLLMTSERWRRDWKALLHFYPNIKLFVADEWQKLGYKSEKSKRTSALREAMEYIPGFIPMSGSLIAGRLDSAYVAIDLVEPRYYTGHDNFMAVHAVVDEYKKVQCWINHEHLGKILTAHGSSRSFASVHGEQAKIIQVEPVELSPKQRECYDKFEKDALLELEDRFLDGTLPGVNAIRCRQILAHPEAIKLPIAHDDKGKPIAWKTYDLMKGEQTGKDARLELHFENHKERKEQVATFGVFHPEIERIALLSQRCGLRTEIIHGGISGTQRSRVDKALRTGDLDSVVATCATAGVGLNWEYLNHVIFGSLDYQDDNFFQAYMRAIRGPRKTPLWITVLEYLRTIEQNIMAIVERKSRDAAKVETRREAIQFRQVQPILSQGNPSAHEFLRQTAARTK